MSRRRPGVRSAGCKEDLLGEMKELSTKGNVMLLGTARK